MKPKIQPDRRRHIRYETDLKIQFFVSFNIKTQIQFTINTKTKRNFSGAIYSAESRNISAEGLSFQSKKKLQKGDKLSLELYVPSAQKPISMVGEVRWCCKVASGNAKEYETGILLSQVEGENVEDSVIVDPIHRIAWSVVLETVFGEFKHILLKKATKK